MMYSMPIWAPGDHAWVLSAVLPVSHATCKMLTRKKYIKWSDAALAYPRMLSTITLICFQIMYARHDSTTTTQPCTHGIQNHLIIP